MAGPMPTVMRLASAPRPCIAARVASRTPVKAPRHPACAAADNPALGIGKEHGNAIGG